jgi:hypothetical protein
LDVGRLLGFSTRAAILGFSGGFWERTDKGRECAASFPVWLLVGGLADLALSQNRLLPRLLGVLIDEMSCLDWPAWSCAQFGPGWAPHRQMNVFRRGISPLLQ